MEPKKTAPPGGNQAAGGESIETYNGIFNTTFVARPNQDIFEFTSDGQPDLLAAAIKYAKWGKPVFPCILFRDSKKPQTKHGFKDASKDSSQVEAWQPLWEKPGALIGMPTGTASGLLVLDVDRKHGIDGLATLAELEKRNGLLPKTGVAETPNGGLHLYFLFPETDPPIGNSAGKLGPGLDIRGQGGYVILPPSVINGRAYRWVDYE